MLCRAHALIIKVFINSAFYQTSRIVDVKHPLIKSSTSFDYQQKTLT